jgi:cobalt transporter subunit CbtB
MYAWIARARIIQRERRAREIGNQALQQSAAATARPVAACRWPALVACAIGLIVVFGVGFAGSATLHDAAHDTRHAFNFPCH